jgi:hypothetical protein
MAAVFVSSLWLVVKPQADQPLLDAFERLTGFGPTYFLSPFDRSTYEEAGADALRFAQEAAKLETREHTARANGLPSADDEGQSIVAYRHGFDEMAQGERFVQAFLRGRARDRERLIVGAPAAILSFVCLAWLGCSPWRRRWMQK